MAASHDFDCTGLVSDSSLATGAHDSAFTSLLHLKSARSQNVP